MPHEHPLHVDVEARCLCCGSLQRFRFASPSDQVVCEHCRTHGGDEKAVRRDREHIALWRGILEHQAADASAAAAAATLSQSEAAAELARVAAERDRLRAGVLDENDPAGAELRRSLQGDLVRRAERATALTARRVDKAMVALWRLQAFHHPDARKPGACTCGRTLAACGESRVLEAQRQDMLDWERRQLVLLKAGERHGLPPEHPEVGAG
ncbi:hypothetical protein BJ978_001453 [Agromyces terreus]|uniref:Uncharacterized protein n=1 Tax=Agromyces terreus TaxID=424795 RepID=A0A9X2GY64_9MICO|nr:hypothetical protein [Agromyces terreus]MCP2370777.1 hypothetical protein [Agromyces terreus]